MPAEETVRQPARPPASWFAQGRGLGLAERALRECTPELTRVFGHSGLFLRPAPEVSATLPGNMLAHVLGLHRNGDVLDGPLRCRDGELPLESGSQSLVLALFVLESSDDAAALVMEIGRVLKPEGVAMVVAMNAWSPSRLQWGGRIGQVLGRGTLDAYLRDASLVTLRHRMLGPAWLGDEPAATLDAPRPAWLDPMRAAALMLAQRREPGMTAVRTAPTRVPLRRGVDPGTAPV